jgi:hypothetical protein
MKLVPYFVRFVTVGLVVGLMACGGGSGSSPSPPATVGTQVAALALVNGGAYVTTNNPRTVGHGFRLRGGDGEPGANDGRARVALCGDR